MGKIALQDSPAAMRVAEFFASSIVWDNHVCPSWRLDDEKNLSVLRRHKTSGVDMVAANVGWDATPWENATLLLARFRRWVRLHPDECLLVETADDIERAAREGKLGVTFNLEGGNALNGSLSMVELYYDLGVRWMLFAYNKNNALAGGCHDEDCGLTDFGRDVLKEMERVGMVVCCSHVGHRTTMEIMEQSSNPVIFSHSNPRALNDHPRCIKDEAIKACAETGGVVGISGIGIFMGDYDANIASIVRSIDYVVDLVGPDHVGLGLDYVFDEEEVNAMLKSNPVLYPPEKYPGRINMVRPEQIPDIADQLLAKGYGAADVRKILGSNHLRIARQVWKPAATRSMIANA